MENIWIGIIGIALGCILWETLSRIVEKNVLEEDKEWERKQKEIRTTK